MKTTTERKIVSEFDGTISDEDVKERGDVEEVVFTISRDREKLRDKEIMEELMKNPVEKAPEKPSKTAQQPKKEKIVKIPSNISQNWLKFQKSQPIAKQSEFIALDCQFVECTDGQQLARISIVNEKGQQLFDEYVRPLSKIVDYRTTITGITYGHIKQAKTWQQLRLQVQKILYRKSLIGHTLYKDLEVMGMTNWSQLKRQIDISQHPFYQEGGKLQSLRKLSSVFLQKEIQVGRHSSLQDAKATMELFLFRKGKILAQIEKKQKKK